MPPANQIKPKKSHGWAVLIFILGTLFPPLAVAARFGIGKDFWINLPLTICGYIPGHVHNFYIQNIRNNKTHARTPKWAVRYGLVDDSKIRRNARRSEWANRYNDREAGDDYENQPVEEGQIPDAPRPPPKTGTSATNGEAPLWGAEDEGYYNDDNGRRATGSVRSGGSNGGGSRWHYPANFDDAVLPAPSSSKPKKSKKKDRWARAEEARLDAASGERRKKKSSRSRTSSYTTDGGFDGPESATGGGYGSGARSDSAPVTADPETMNHEF